MSKAILIWHQGALGDLLLSLPSIWSLRNHYKDSTLHLVSREDVRDLLLLNKIADEHSSNESGFYAGLYSGGVACGPKLKEFLNRFDAAFLFQKNADGIFLETITGEIPSSVRIKTVPDHGNRVHVSSFQLQQLEARGIASDYPVPLLSRPEQKLPGRIAIAVHPGSGGNRKCWPLANYFDLVSRLSSRRQPEFRFLLGPAEDKPVHDQINEFSRRNKISLEIISGRNILTVTETLSGASLYIGNDSGVTHLASTLGVPTVAIFGPTDPAIWGPFGGKAVILKSGAACSPCSEPEFRECKEQKCLENIGAEEVLSKTELVMKTLK